MGEGSEANFQKNVVFSSFPFDEFSIYPKSLFQTDAKSSLLVGRPSSAVHLTPCVAAFMFKNVGVPKNHVLR